MEFSTHWVSELLWSTVDSSKGQWGDWLPSHVSCDIFNVCAKVSTHGAYQLTYEQRIKALYSACRLGLHVQA